MPPYGLFLVDLGTPIPAKSLDLSPPVSLTTSDLVTDYSCFERICSRWLWVRSTCDLRFTLPPFLGVCNVLNRLPPRRPVRSTEADTVPGFELIWKLRLFPPLGLIESDPGVILANLPPILLLFRLLIRLRFIVDTFDVTDWG